MHILVKDDIGRLVAYNVDRFDMLDVITIGGRHKLTLRNMNKEQVTLLTSDSSNYLYSIQKKVLNCMIRGDNVCDLSTNPNKLEVIQ